MRTPSARGFYPFSENELRKSLELMTRNKAEKKRAVGAIAPHAGYAYSGMTAATVYSSIKTGKKTFAIFCPNHTGYGSRVAMSADDWQTPLGIVKTDRRFEGKIPVDEKAHEYEHSLEVQLPFLQHFFRDAKIIPICLWPISINEIKSLAKKIVARDIFYIASSDFTHFGPDYGYMPVDMGMEKNPEYVKKMDKKAIEFILELEPEKFYEFVTGNGMTICGLVPITLLLFVCRELGASKAKILDYSTSYEKSPGRSFVSYAGIIIT